MTSFDEYAPEHLDPEEVAELLGVPTRAITEHEEQEQ